jgi:DNA helicase-2/ATP-dependent DNA helicase PcrA
LERAAVDAVDRYLQENAMTLRNTMNSEDQIQVHVAPGVTVDGRIDLIRRLDTDETSIVDFKSSERAQAEEVTRDQLHVYALGYQELTGETPDLIEVLNLDPEQTSKREPQRLRCSTQCGSESGRRGLASSELPAKAQDVV